MNSIKNFKPVVAQLKTAVRGQNVASRVANHVYRPLPVPKVLQTKMAQRPAAPVPCKPKPAVPPASRPDSLPNCAQRKTATPQPKRPPVFGTAKNVRNTIQRAAALMEHKEPAADNSRVVFCVAFLNGVKLGKAWSRKSAYLAKGASEHAEDVIIDYIDWLETLLMFPILAAHESAETVELAASLNNKRDLVIMGLTASPCCSTPMGEAKVATTTKKDGELGCAEKLIGLRKRKYSITIHADHFYQGKLAGGKAASVEACKKMAAAGIKIVIAHP